MNRQRLFDDALHLRDDGRTMEGKFVPFGEVARVSDPGSGIYEEVFDAGCMTRLCQAAKQRGNAAFIRLDLDHSDAFDNRIGYAVDIEQRDDGGYGTFKLYDGPALPKVRSMLEESHTGLSVNFSDIGKARVVGTVTHRTQIAIASVAATPVPSYAGARVLALRSLDEAEELVVETPTFDEVRDWLRSQTPGGTTPWDGLEVGAFHREE